MHLDLAHGGVHTLHLYVGLADLACARANFVSSHQLTVPPFNQAKKFKGPALVAGDLDVTSIQTCRWDAMFRSSDAVQSTHRMTQVDLSWLYPSIIT